MFMSTTFSELLYLQGQKHGRLQRNITLNR
jgi:hypothetical protein